jgi:hypothetical protein
MAPSRSLPRPCFWPAFAGLLLTLGVASPAAGQLRPLDPFEWRVYDEAHAVAAELGGSILFDQRAALAGTEGRLMEAGNFRAFWRTGRVVLEAGGTLQRFFRDEARFGPPHPHTDPAVAGNRHDSGDYRAVTTVRLTPAGAAITGILRFGTRLPTTDNASGLDRDATDFFALAGMAVRRGGVLAGIETGVSINGTRDPEFEQKDVMPYMLVAEWTRGPLQPRLSIVGELPGDHPQVRGNEPHGEIRLGARTHGRHWLRIDGVLGYRTASPSWGVMLAAGSTW